jgi:hypothetical protein
MAITERTMDTAAARDGAAPGAGAPAPLRTRKRYELLEECRQLVL